MEAKKNNKMIQKMEADALKIEIDNLITDKIGLPDVRDSKSSRKEKKGDITK
jgi:hypothetical protein